MASEEIKVLVKHGQITNLKQLGSQPQVSLVSVVLTVTIPGFPLRRIRTNGLWIWQKNDTIRGMPLMLLNLATSRIVGGTIYGSYGPIHRDRTVRVGTSIYLLVFLSNCRFNSEKSGQRCHCSTVVPFDDNDNIVVM
ncbi:hypothetical protein T08_7584 [Trichinella sp. T8]|nr:hypothetical protein T08_7584 [Trichinella sp. T8]